jgi:hypothetical protein
MFRFILATCLRELADGLAFLANVVEDSIPAQTSTCESCGSRTNVTRAVSYPRGCVTFVCVNCYATGAYYTEDP